MKCGIAGRRKKASARGIQVHRNLALWRLAPPGARSCAGRLPSQPLGLPSATPVTCHSNARPAPALQKYRHTGGVAEKVQIVSVELQHPAGEPGQYNIGRIELSPVGKPTERFLDMRSDACMFLIRPRWRV